MCGKINYLDGFFIEEDDKDEDNCDETEFFNLGFMDPVKIFTLEMISSFTGKNLKNLVKLKRLNIYMFIPNQVIRWEHILKFTLSLGQDLHTSSKMTNPSDKISGYQCPTGT